MKILVTGGSGLVGKHTVNFLARTHKVSVLDIKEPPSDHPFYHVDVMDLPALLKTFALGFDAIVHMAGIPHPLNDPAEKVFQLNVLGTFNVLEAAAQLGVKKIVFISSESVLGFAFMTKMIVPMYIPIDEEHPLSPQDPYGLSKLLGEQTCRSYALRYGMKTICFRPAWIWVPERKEIELYRTLIHEYPKWSKNLWAYVHVEDFASALLSGLESENLDSDEIFFVTADDNWTGKESRLLLKEHYPSVQRIAKTFVGQQSLISSAKAKRRLGYKPKHSWREFVHLPSP